MPKTAHDSTAAFDTAVGATDEVVDNEVDNEITDDGINLELDPATDGEGDGDETPAPKAAKSNVTFRIGSKVFDTKEAAEAYAEELERETLAGDAYRQGLVDAQAALGGGKTGTTTAPVDPLDEEINVDEYYQDPVGFIKRDRRKVADYVTNQIEQRLSAKETVNNLWKEFYTLNDDLVGREEIVNLSYSQIADVLGKMNDKNKIFDVLADHARKKLQKLVGEMTPRETLTTTTREASTGYSARPAAKATKAATQKTLGFADQVRKLRESKLRNQA